MQNVRWTVPSGLQKSGASASPGRRWSQPSAALSRSLRTAPSYSVYGGNTGDPANPPADFSIHQRRVGGHVRSRQRSDRPADQATSWQHVRGRGCGTFFPACRATVQVCQTMHVQPPGNLPQPFLAPHDLLIRRLRCDVWITPRQQIQGCLEGDAVVPASDRRIPRYPGASVMTGSPGKTSARCRSPGKTSARCKIGPGRITLSVLSFLPSGSISARPRRSVGGGGGQSCGRHRGRTN